MSEEQIVSAMKPLYDAHKWIELNDRLGDTKANSIYRSAIGVTFNQDPSRTEQMLLSAIRSAPSCREVIRCQRSLKLRLQMNEEQFKSVRSTRRRCQSQRFGSLNEREFCSLLRSELLTTGATALG